MPSTVAPAWNQWYVVNTKPGKEELVRVMLGYHGLEVFLPMVLEWSTGRRRMREQVRHLFPGYVFVRMSRQRDYPRVRWTPGVRRVLGAGDVPEPIDGSFVEEIAARMGHRGYLVQRPDLRAGDTIEVRRGPFSGLLGVVEAPSTARERVRVLLTIFERRTSVEMETRDLVRMGHRLGRAVR